MPETILALSGRRDLQHDLGKHGRGGTLEEPVGCHGRTPGRAHGWLHRGLQIELLLLESGTSGGLGCARRDSEACSGRAWNDDEALQALGSLLHGQQVQEAEVEECEVRSCCHPKKSCLIRVGWQIGRPGSLTLARRSEGTQ